MLVKMNMKSNYAKTIFRHLTAPIILAILVLAFSLLVLGRRQDAVFVSSVVAVNVVLGSFQEIRAQRELKKLELLIATKAKVKRGDQFVEVDANELARQDIIKLELGDEVPADAEITENHGLECDESLLTGESAAVKKKLGEMIFASTSVVSGWALAEVTAVGAMSKAGMMESRLKSYDPQITPIQKMIARAIQILTGVAGVVAIVILVRSHIQAQPLVEAVVKVTSAAVTLVPEGLLLASTVFLAYGSLRLAQAKVLPQKISAIESMALLDVICVDKTGTLTSPEIIFNNLEFVGNVRLPNLYQRLIWALTADHSTATAKAINQALPKLTNYRVVEQLAFSSERKISGLKVRRLLREYSLLMGAPEYIAKFAKLSPEAVAKVDALTERGLRVVLVATLPKNASFEDLDDTAADLLAIISLSNELRPGVPETIDFLQQNGIHVKVISGDHPQTVSFIAKRAGINDFDRITTGEELDRAAKVGHSAWAKLVLGKTIFARVKPEQKEKIIATFRKEGLHTGMVGDGVNDALAIKQSDLGISMFAGAPATRRVADLILLDDAFTTLPMGIQLGNQVIQSIELIACLFFHKISLTLTLLLACFVTNQTYPFGPRHVTFMNIFLVTLPTIIFTLFPPKPSRRLSPKRFWQDTLFRVLPIGVISGLGVFVAYVVASLLAPAGGRFPTIAVLAASFFGVYAVFLVNSMFATEQTSESKLAAWVYVTASSVIAIASFSFTFTRSFFDFANPTGWGLLLALVIILIIASIQGRIAEELSKYQVKSKS